MKIYSNNLNNEYNEIVKSAKSLHIDLPIEIKLE